MEIDKTMIHVQVPKSTEGLFAPKRADVHLLPFKIHADCDAKVSKYFTNTIKTTKMGHKTASFRGYPLLGETIHVPADYKGIILHESPCLQKERNLYVVNNFDRFTYWNWSKVPSKNDTMQQALDWIDIAEALHTPIHEE